MRYGFQVAVLFWAGLATGAQEPSWEQLVTAANQLAATGDFGAAERAIQQIAEISRRFGAGDPRLAVALNNLGSVYQDQGRYQEAERLYTESLSVWQNAKPDAVGTAFTWNNFGTLCWITGRYSKALQMLQRALDLVPQPTEAAALQRARILNNIGLVNHSQGNSTAAEARYREALAIYDVQPKAGPDGASCLNNLSLVLHDRGALGEATILVGRSTAILRETLGPRHPLVVKALINTASYEVERKDYRAAEIHLREAAGIAAKTYGAEHPFTASVESRLAGVLRKTGHARDARAIERRISPILSDYARHDGARNTIEYSGIRASRSIQ